MISDLEDEHNRLLAEHDDLSRQLMSMSDDVICESGENGESGENKLREATRMLKQDTQRMETRMNILQVCKVFFNLVFFCACHFDGIVVLFIG
jgi:hypothetical protein